MADDTVSLAERLDDAEAQAEVLTHAAKLLDELVEEHDEMVDDGELSDDDVADEMEEHLQTARDTCEKMSLALTMALIEEGRPPDFDDPPWEGGDDDADGAPSAFA